MKNQLSSSIKQTTAIACVVAVFLGGGLLSSAQAEGLKVANNFAKMSESGYDLSVLPIDRISGGLRWFGADVLDSRLDTRVESRFGVEASLANPSRLGQSAAENLISRAYFVDAVGLYPVARDLALLGRLGRFQGQYDRSLVSGASSLGLKAGLGLQYEFNKSLSLRGDWERFHLDSLGSQPERDRYSLGVNYRF